MKFKTYSFEKLDVWQKARSFTKDIYLKTRNFPDEEKFGLVSQTRRAMISVSCNIVEGTTRWSSKEKTRFIEIAFSSLMEVLNCLILASDMEYIEDEDLFEFRGNLDEIANKLNSLANAYKK